MLDDQVRQTHAALPLTAFIAGLVVAGQLVNTNSFLAGLVAVTILLIAGSSKRFLRSALVAFCLLTGVVTGKSEERGRVAALSMVESVGDERFATIEAEIVRTWGPTEWGGYRLEARSFGLVSSAVSHDLPIAIYLNSQPPEIGNSRSIIAEGFLHAEDGRFSMTIKSRRLISYHGSLQWWNPARWNRSINTSLTRLLTRYPRYARPVALVRAVVLGRSEALPDEVRESYRRGGIYHLLVFSGMQIAVGAAFLSWFFRRLGAPRAGDTILLALAAFAPAFAGNEPSVTRASWMIGLYASCRLIRRPTSFENLLLVSALLRLIVHPDELTDPGFALTYAATAGLIFIGKPLAALMHGRKWLAAIGYSAGAEIATAALTRYFFRQYVMGGSVMTLLATPVISAMLGLSALVCVTVTFSMNATLPLLETISLLDRLCDLLTSVASRFHLYGMTAAPDGNFLALCAGLALSTISLSHRLRGAALLSLLCLAPIVQSTLSLRAARKIDGFRVEVLDVGQGDAILLRSRQGAVLIDGGGRNGDLRFGRRVLLPLLLDQGVNELHAVGMSHPDPDHCVGLIDALRYLSVRELWMSRRHVNAPCSRILLQLAAENETSVLFLDRVPEIERAGMVFEPSTARLKLKRSPMNNSSLVLRARLGTRTVLLAGDLERDGERMLADEQPGRLGADVLKIAHHGSRTSTTDEFLHSVMPRAAILSCGVRNRFGHPNESVLKTLQTRRIPLYRTDQDGTVLLSVQNGALFVTPQFDTPR